LLKTVVFDVGGRTVMVLVPGDRDVSANKLEKLMFPDVVRPLTDEDFTQRGLVKGFVGPTAQDGDVLILADRTVQTGAEWITGANQADHHLRNTQAGRDFRIDRVEDLAEFREGDPCPECGGELRIGRSIVVAHIYQLGTKYSAPLEATFQDEDGTHRLFEMGCYGAGISRILAAVIEQHHDEAGITWPKAIAPAQVAVILATRDHEPSVQAAEQLYADLQAGGTTVVLDDREAAAGVKFNDADLVGYPVQVVVGKRGVEAGQLDVKIRATGERRQVAADGGAGAVLGVLADAP
jgi:prolyl-tRNA synthetase